MLSALRVSAANTISTGSNVAVAVIDTGVDESHIDLRGRVIGEVDLTSSGPEDESGHGTLMAGVLAGIGHGPSHARGVRGIAPDVTVLSIKATVTDAFGTPTLVEAIETAIAHHVAVICLALGGTGSSDRLEKAVSDAIKANVVVVAATGNKPEANSVTFPAAYPGVIAAAGTDEHGNHAAVSVTGPQVVLSAPATNIVSTLNDGGYGIGTGTSNSAAIIAGAAALVRSRFPHLSAAEVVHRLEATATDKGPPGRDDEYGFGIVNLIGALTANVPPLSPDADLTPSPSPTSVGASAGHHHTTSPLIFVAIGVLLIGGLFLTLRIKK
jgi:subtilisin family serine protease